MRLYPTNSTYYVEQDSKKIYLCHKHAKEKMLKEDLVFVPRVK